MNISPKTAEGQDIPSMNTKCGDLRFVFVDEIEATGADILGELDNHVRHHMSNASPFKFDWITDEMGRHVKAAAPRSFGGANVIFLGDFWQLSPTGQIAIMSDPYAEKVKGSAKANDIMRMFWKPRHESSLRTWPDGKRVLHLTRNERSGADTWFSQLLNSCREGCLTETDYNFLHGYPTETKVDSWYVRRDDKTWRHVEELCKYEKYHLLDHWKEWPGAYECEDCWRERKRRARALHLDSHEAQGQERLADPHFAESVLITQYNMAVFHFAQARAINFARASKAQAFWIQAADSPPNWFCNGFSSQELDARKKTWLSYHARKTEGVLSLLLCCYDSLSS